MSARAFRHACATFDARILPGEEVIVRAEAAVGLAGQKLVVQHPEDFFLTSAKVDGVEMFRTVHLGWRGLFGRLLGQRWTYVAGLPATTFAADTLGNGFSWPRARREVTLTVRCLASGSGQQVLPFPRVFHASLFGLVETEEAIG